MNILPNAPKIGAAHQPSFSAPLAGRLQDTTPCA